MFLRVKTVLIRTNRDEKHFVKKHFIVNNFLQKIDRILIFDNFVISFLRAIKRDQRAIIK